MREDGRSMSRNRNFHTFADPQARRALRIVRHLRDLEADLKGRRECAAGAHADDGSETVQVRLEYPALKASRTAYLSPQEFALLLQDPGVSASLL